MSRVFSLLFFSVLALFATASERLWQEFVTPPDSARTKVWWFHGEAAETPEGIGADLQAFRDKGVGGVVWYDQVHGNGQGADPSMSPRWWELLKHGARKAKELGLSFEVAVGNGYVTGGPWITRELAMKKTVFTDTIITLDKPAHVSLPIPAVAWRVASAIFPEKADNASLSFPGEREIRSLDTIIPLPTEGDMELCGIAYTITPRGKGSTGSMNIPCEPQERYAGAMYVDYPSPGELEYSHDGIIWHQSALLLSVENNIGHKSRVRTISFPRVSAPHWRLHIHDWQADDGGKYPTIKIGDIRLHRRDIVDNIEAKNGLRTEVRYPAAEGDDRNAIPLGDIICVTDSSTVLPAGTWHIVTLGYAPTGARTKHGRKNLLGYEADVMSAEAANLHFDNYFGPVCDTLAAIGCRPQGMCMDSHEAGTANWTRGLENKFYAHAGYDLLPWIPALAGYVVGSRGESEQMLLDFRKCVASTIASEYYGTLARRCHEKGVDYTSQAMLNILTDNLAGRGRTDKPQGEFWAYQKEGNYDVLDAASAAHIYGHPIASGEAFTDTPYGTPWNELLRIAALAYAKGINEFAVCASTAQGQVDKMFDDSQSAHPYIFHRFNPDWATSGPFWDYQARSANLLRKGRPVVDLCVYIGEDAPLKTMAYKLPRIPAGYNFDVANGDALMHRFSAGEDGQLCVEGGMRYSVLVIQDRTYISPEAEAAIERLCAGGVPVVRCDRGENLADRLAEINLKPDVDAEVEALHFFHRSAPEGEIYFLYNHRDTPFETPLKLRSINGQADVWDPVALTRRPAGDTLRLEPWQSVFVIGK